ncbi:MAG: uncharacterized protein KVP18_003659 [Porospora cf. gigantea A]|uniref:uncharacterized protein n=2 Tax=Porospora cf. gigantea A TaxID=2853593 RepID=UPI00355ACC13|nr:MAG: hypothetical protein KVP18_003659 [Porospora cf. gigantea A]
MSSIAATEVSVSSEVSEDTNAVLSPSPSIPPQGCWRNLIGSTNPPVFFSAALLLVVFLTLTASIPAVPRGFQIMLEVLNQNFSWFYIGTFASVLFLIAFLFFSRFADIRLGSDYDEPEFSSISWFSMLFSAGMGIGLVFYSVSEPITFLNYPPLQSYGIRSEFMRQNAVPLTLFHWCFHGWAVYLIMGMSIAYFSFRLGLPLTIRSCFYPVLGRYIFKWPGHVIDVIAVFGCLFGLATSLGAGATNISAGMNFLWGVPDTSWVQAVIIVVTTLCAIGSLLSGLDKGIKILSNVNLTLAFLLALFVIVTGPTRLIFDAFVDNTGGYINVLLQRCLRTGAYDPYEKEWMQSWTIFYVAWWASWSPFVGMFIARISRGRTIREFIGGVMLVPSLVSVFWFTVFGSTAIQFDMDPNVANGEITKAVQANTAVAVYKLLEYLPWAQVSSVLAMVVILVFFVTSSDSGSFVVDLLTSDMDTLVVPVWQRIFWATAEGATAAILLLAGGTTALSGLQACVVSIGFPLCILVCIMMVSLVRGLYQDPKFLLETSPDFGKSLERRVDKFLKRDRSQLTTNVGGTRCGSFDSARGAAVSTASAKPFVADDHIINDANFV